MDEIVRQAMAKWPNVPHCYGWLALDARGNWRMRDERAQALQLPGDTIRNPALLGFINRNYTHDEAGRWYFQNGPQRVYLNLEATPYIARTVPEGFQLHTGAPLESIAACWLTDEGRLILRDGEVIAQVDDRDTAQCLGMLRRDGQILGDEALLEWLERPEPGSIALECHEQLIPVGFLLHDQVAGYFGFKRVPMKDDVDSTP